MCSIVGSYDKEKFKELVELNSYRGSFSNSITVFSPNKPNITIKNFGKMDFELLDQFIGPSYFLGHSQSPTNGLVLEFNRIHPCRIIECGTNFSLLHNGIIKPHYVDLLNSRYDTAFTWDTEALCHHIVESLSRHGWECLDEVDGSFACAAFGSWQEVHIFRNSAAPLFLDKDSLDISSTKFPKGELIPVNKVLAFDLFSHHKWESTFNNKHNPFYFG